MGAPFASVCRFAGLPGGSEQWVRYRVLYTAPGGTQLVSEWCAEASCAVARADLRVVGLSSVEALTLDAVLDSHADVVRSLRCAGFEVQLAASRAGLAESAASLVGPPPAGKATVKHRCVTAVGHVRCCVCSLALVPLPPFLRVRPMVVLWWCGVPS
jgi:hypothetical protein